MIKMSPQKSRGLVFWVFIQLLVILTLAGSLTEIMLVQAEVSLPSLSFKSNVDAGVTSRNLAAKSELSDCLERNSQVLIDLFIVPQCSFSRIAAKGLLEIIAEFEEFKLNESRSKPDLDANSLGNIFVTVNPLQCVEYQKGFLYSSTGDELLCDSDVFSGYRSITDLLSLSRDVLCFQYLNEYPEININFSDFMNCRLPIKSFAGSQICWNQFGNDPDSMYLSRCHNRADSGFRKVIENALTSAANWNIDGSPTLIINGKKYCGSYSKQELIAAVCAASQQNPIPVSNLDKNWQVGMPVNGGFDRSCNTKWWEAAGVIINKPDLGTCIVQPQTSLAEYLPVLLTSFFLMISVSFFCMVITRHRVDALLVQQRRRDASSSHIQELLQILALERNIQRQFRSGDSTTNANVTRTREQVEDILKSKLKLNIYHNSAPSNKNDQVAIHTESRGGSHEDIEAGCLSHHNEEYTSQQRSANSMVTQEQLPQPYPEASELSISNTTNNTTSNSLDLGEAVDQTCPICLEVFENGDEYYEIQCGHLLHKDCLIQWTMKKNECPMCRGMIVPELEPPAPSEADVNMNAANGLGNVEIELQNLGMRGNHDASPLNAVERRERERQYRMIGLNPASSFSQTIFLSTGSGNGAGNVRTITLNTPRDVNIS